MRVSFRTFFLPIAFAFFAVAIPFQGAGEEPASAPPPAPDFANIHKFGKAVSEKAIVRICSSGVGDRPELHGCLVRGPEIPKRAFITNSEEAPWLILDLQETFAITGVHVVNAAYKTVVSGNKPLTLELSTDSSTWTKVFEDTAEKAGVDWKIDLAAKSTPARYVRIGLKHGIPRIFQLKRVTVYGKPPAAALPGPPESPAASAAPASTLLHQH
jgi:hypothetical protein